MAAYTRNPQTVPDDRRGGDSTRYAVAQKLNQGIDDVITDLNAHSNNEDGLSHAQIDARFGDNDIRAAKQQAEIVKLQNTALTSNVPVFPANKGQILTNDGVNVMWMDLPTSKKPENTTPANGASNIIPQTLTGGAHASLYGYSFQSRAFQTSRDSEFNDIIEEVTAGALSSPITQGKYPTQSTVWWRCRDTNSNGDVSEWSDPTVFTTAAVYQFIEPPTILAPTNGATVLVSPLVISLSPIQVEPGGTADHVKSRYIVSSDEQGDNVLYDSGEVDDLTYHSATIPGATQGQTLYVRALQKDNTRGWSGESNPVQITAQIISHGMRVDGGTAIGPYDFADGERGYLVVPPFNQVRNSVKWGLYDTNVSELGDISSGDDTHTGVYNTNILTSSKYSSIDDGQGSVGAPAATYCSQLTFESQADFFLPNIQEAEKIWQNRATVDAGNGDSGSQSLAGTTSGYFWTSSENSPGYAWSFVFSIGSRNNSSKVHDYLVVPARRILI